MNKKKLRLMYCLVFGIFLIGISAFVFAGSFNSEDEREIGYEFLDSGIVLSPNVFRGWNYHLIGNESVLYDIKSITNNQICIIPKDIKLSPIIREELDITKPILDKDEKEIIDYELKIVTYTYPSSINMYDVTDSRILLGSKSLSLDKEVDSSICFDLDYKNSLFYRIGEESIIISAEEGYDSTDVNVTQENKFAHLNLTDGNLSLYFPFDVVEDSNDITYDYTNNSFDGTLQGGTAFDSSSGFIGGAYDFDGVNDYITMGDVNLDINETMTVMVWANIKSTETHSLVSKWKPVGSQREWDFRFNSANGLRINFGSSSGGFAGEVASLSSVTVGEWALYGFTFDSGTVRIFDNGQNISTFSTISITYLFSGTAKLQIGSADGGAGFQYANATIDEVMIFNRVLSDEEILDIFNSQTSRFTPTGTMTFTNLNFGTNNTINITIPDCQQLNGSSIRFKVNNGDYVQLNSSCMYDNYIMEGDLSSANVVLKLDSGDYNFYSSLVVGNITLDSWNVIQDTCTYTSGNWNVECSDYCNITDVTSLPSNNLTLYGSGTFTILANITADKVIMDTNCQVNNLAGDNKKLMVV